MHPISRAFTADKIIWWLLLLAAVIRVAAFIDMGVMYDGGFRDAQGYMDSARVLVSTGRLTFYGGSQSALVMPGFVVFLAACCAVVATRFAEYVVVKLALVLVSCATIYVLHLLGRRIAGPRVGILAASMLALSMPSIYVGTLALSENLYSLFLLGFVLAVIGLADRPGMRRLLLAAALFSLAVYTRQAALGAAPGALVYLMLRGVSPKTISRYAAIFALVFIVAMAPWWIRNYSVFGEFVPFTSGDGSPFFEGTYQRFEPYGTGAFEAMDNVIAGFKGTEAEKSGLLESAARVHLAQRWSQSPWDVLSTYLITKPAAAWALPFYWDSVFSISGYWVLRIHSFVSAMGLIALGWLSFRSESRAEWALLFMNVLVITAGASYYLGLSRYVYPYMPFLYIAVSFVLSRALGSRWPSWRESPDR